MMRARESFEGVYLASLGGLSTSAASRAVDGPTSSPRQVN